MPLLLRTAALLLCLSSPLLAQAPAPTPDLRTELEHYKLTPARLTSYMQIMGDLLRAQKTNARLRDAIRIDFDRDTSPAQYEQRITAVPEIVAIVKLHALEPHEFAILNWTVIWADLCAMGHPDAKPGTTPEACATPPHIDPANIPFMRRHQTDLGSLRTRYWPADDSTP